MNLEDLRKKAILRAKKDIQESVSENEFIVHTINNIDELAKTSNGLAKRLRHWYVIYFPELSEKIDDNETFVIATIDADKKVLMKKYGVDISMGKDLDEKDLAPIITFAKHIKTQYELRDELKKYLDEVIKAFAPNLYTLLGSLLAAKLIREARSLEGLAMCHASKIQLFGAEQALFRHLVSGARSPKHGIIIQHPIVANARKEDKGKAARGLADKISIMARIDFFKGEFIADKVRKELEEKFK